MNWKNFGKKLLYPRGWVMVWLTILSAAALIAVFINGWEVHPAASVIYVIAFYTMTVVCVYFAKVLPNRYKQIKQKVYDHPYGNRYLTDAAFRTHVSLYLSLAVNLMYAGVNMLSGVLYETAWFGILAGYYIILAVMRFILLRYVNRNAIGSNMMGEWRIARICTAILTLINLVLSGAILMIMYQNRGFAYPGILIYVMAMYTFYITAAAIANMIKYRKYNSPIISTTKIITLAAALVSMLSLETAMLTAFGAEMTVLSKRIFIAATGAGISIVVLTMSSYIIVRATCEINRIKKEQQIHE